MARRIENDEQYMKAAQYLIDIAELEEDPLDDRTEDQKQRDMAIFDRTADLMQYYRHNEMARMFPYLREMYVRLGIDIEDAPNADSQIAQMSAMRTDSSDASGKQDVSEVGDSDVPESRLPEGLQTNPDVPAVDLNDWLDDE